MIYFNHPCPADYYTIDRKMSVLKMIDIANSNSNVGTIRISVHSKNQWNSEILRLMTNRYPNVYYIEIIDWDNHIDHQVHDLIK